MSSIPVSFSSPDDPALHDLLQQACQANLQVIPQVGLIFKTRIAADGSEQLVNWQLADASLVQSIALGLYVSDTQTQ